MTKTGVTRISKANLADFHAWAAFKSHTLTLKDQNKTTCLLDFAADQHYDLEMRHHHKCLPKYMFGMSQDEKLLQMQNITFKLCFLTTF